MRRVKILDFFGECKVLLRNLIAHFCIMSTDAKNDSSASLTLFVLVSMPVF